MSLAEVAQITEKNNGNGEAMGNSPDPLNQNSSLLASSNAENGAVFNPLKQS